MPQQKLTIVPFTLHNENLCFQEHNRKNWLFSVSEAGAKANAICLSIAETTKANGVDFYRYLLKLLTDLPNLNFYQQPEILNQYMPWSKMIQEEYGR